MSKGTHSHLVQIKNKQKQSELHLRANQERFLKALSVYDGNGALNPNEHPPLKHYLDEHLR